MPSSAPTIVRSRLDKQESIRGSQYLAIRYTERLAEAGAVPSVGLRGDSYDNDLAGRSTACTRPS
jgi:transposase InsO family protein